MEEDHLTLEQIADILADRGLSEPVHERLAAHAESCPDCRQALDLADTQLDAAAMAIEGAQGASTCPDALELATFVQDWTAGAAFDELREHIEACEHCRTVLDELENIEAHTESSASALLTRTEERSRRPYQSWWVGSGLLAAAVLAGLLIFPVRETMHVNIVAYPAARVRDVEDAQSSDRFGVQVELDQPGWVHLLVLDRAGQLTFLAAEAVEQSVEFGGYGIHPPGHAGESDKVRIYALLILGQADLREALAGFDYDPVPLSRIEAELQSQVDGILQRLIKALDADGRVMRIPGPQ